MDEHPKCGGGDPSHHKPCTPACTSEEITHYSPPACTGSQRWRPVWTILRQMGVRIRSLIGAHSGGHCADWLSCPLLTQSGHSDTSYFDLDQIQDRRTRTIVNNGLAFCETGLTNDLTRVMSA
jgi:hypothetical protein